MEKNIIIQNIIDGNFNQADLLEFLTGNDSEIAYAVASCAFASEDVLSVAAIDRERCIRLAAANNSNISTNILLRLCKDEDSAVARCAQEKMEKRV